MSEEEYDRAAYAPAARVVSNEKEERLKKSKRWLGMQVVSGCRRKERDAWRRLGEKRAMRILL